MWRACNLLINTLLLNKVYMYKKISTDWTAGGGSTCHRPCWLQSRIKKIQKNAALVNFILSGISCRTSKWLTGGESAKKCGENFLQSFVCIRTVRVWQDGRLVRRVWLLGRRLRFFVFFLHSSVRSMIHSPHRTEYYLAFSIRIGLRRSNQRCTTRRLQVLLRLRVVQVRCYLFFHFILNKCPELSMKLRPSCKFGGDLAV